VEIRLTPGRSALLGPTSLLGRGGFEARSNGDVGDRSYGAVMDDAQIEDPPWEPPRAGTEVEALTGALDRLRATFRWKVDGLDSAGLNATIPSSTLTLGGLLKHLALVEDYQSTVKMTGEPLGEPWASLGMDEDDPEWEFTSAAADTPDELYALYDGAVRRYRERVATKIEAGGGLDGPVAVGGGEFNLRRLMFDLVEEYGRHTGHADLLREAMDGRTGEDPDPGWQPPI
jgi:hypothetical protein